MMAPRRTALIAGVCYLLTFASVPTVALYQPVRDDGFSAGGGPAHAVVAGGALEIVAALACIGTAVVLYPVLRRHSEVRVLGFAGARVLEAATIFVGVAAVLAMVTLRRDGAGAGAAGTGQALLAFYDGLFIIGQGFLPAVNAVLLGTLLLQYRLVPRWLPVLGLAGAPLLVGSDAGVLLGAWDRLSPVAAAAALPVAVWEFGLGVHLVLRGLRE
ncbi:DUF4386 domain-containing protein [Actinoplanes sp. N902-109]|uniref:DUF4386 domain-containing protein n=1 Tax=Actinoplanes sp. (strain N902-109) TaxID=649831 RepID=UPI0005A0A448|nr:DUF4386 domain-containing protein [Actinoplanes sp. N902-109]